MAAEPTLAEIIRAALDSRLGDVHVALPGRVETYDAATNTADVLPTVRRAIRDTNGDTQHEDLPVIPNVPVLFPRGGGDAYSITFPIAKGDHVLLVFCSWAIGPWRESGDVSNPADLRKHSLGNPIAIPGIAPKTGSLPTDPAAMILEGPAVHVGASASVFVALSSLVDARLTELYDAINGAVPLATDGGAQFKTQLLASLATAGWVPGGPQPTVASTKLKSE